MQPFQPVKPRKRGGQLTVAALIAHCAYYRYIDNMVNLVSVQQVAAKPIEW